MILRKTRIYEICRSRKTQAQILTGLSLILFVMKEIVIILWTESHAGSYLPHTIFNDGYIIRITLC